METLHHQRIQEKLVEQNEAVVKQQPATTTTTATATASTSSQPPSATSSPSHEFSFTISLHHSSSSSTTPQPPVDPDKKTQNKSSASPFAIDLSPADDIFFHGHLLPLHLLSHLPVSPRSSTNSLDSFTLPIKELLDDDQQKKPNKNSSKSNFCNDIDIEEQINNPIHDQINKGKRNKPRSNFSLFGLTKWRKGCESREGEEEEEEKEKDKKKIRLDLTQVLKRYVKMVRPLFFKKREDLQIRRQSYSFSGNLSSRKSKQQLIRGRRGEFSAPASMRTSPTNSGLLLATTTSNVSSSSTNDSTMEELQAAIQAAIAHCKNSIAVEDKLKC